MAFPSADDTYRHLMKNATSQAERDAIMDEWKRMRELDLSPSRSLYLGPGAMVPFSSNGLSLRTPQPDPMDGFLASYQNNMVALAASWGFAAAAEPKKAKRLKPLPEDHIVSAIVGYRAWNAPLFVDELRSVAMSTKWKPYQRLEAGCGSEKCCGVSCSCGIYAFKAMDDVQSEYTHSDRSTRYVWGECWLWGRVLECAKGYRAQFAYPKSFVNSGAFSKRMAEVFGVTLTK